MRITTQRVESSTGHGMSVVLVDGVEVGYITKVPDSRTGIHPYTAYVGIGGGARLLGSYYTETQLALIYPDAEDPAPPPYTHGGGFQAAKRAVVDAALNVVDDRPEPPRTRADRLQAAADAGIDTWADYRGEK